MKKMSKEKTIAIVVVVVVVLAIIGYAVSHKKSGGPNGGQNPGQMDALQSNGGETPSTTPTSQTGSGINSTLSYSQALKTYYNTRFEFTGCQATPGHMVIKKDQKFMLDNRGSGAH